MQLSASNRGFIWRMRKVFAGTNPAEDLALKNELWLGLLVYRQVSPANK